MQVESTPLCLCITRITGLPMPSKESPRLSMVWSLSTERDWSASEIQQLEELTPSALDRTEECQLPPGLKFKEPNITPSAGKFSPLVTSRVSSILEFPWVALQSVMWWQLQKRCPTASTLWKVSLVTLTSWRYLFRFKYILHNTLWIGAFLWGYKSFWGVARTNGDDYAHIS